MIKFNVLVQSILMYEVETWGWQEKKKIEDLRTRYKVGFGILHTGLCGHERNGSYEYKRRSGLQST